MFLKNGVKVQIKYCAKTDFKPFTTEYVSRGYKSEMMYDEASSEHSMAKMSAAETINTVFTPEDVRISETLYCLWIAE